MKDMLIELHMLKSYPPTNLNRDDSGAPKSCMFGGVMRGRISSQCLKRTWRMSDIFQDAFSEAERGIRTRRLVEEVWQMLEDSGVSTQYQELVTAQLKILGKADKEPPKGKQPKGAAKKSDAGSDSEKEKKNQILMLSQGELDLIFSVTKQAIDDGLLETEKKWNIKDALTKEKVKNLPMPLCVALFGRMVTDPTFDNVDAAMQVAHAFSTHRMNLESDYFTAVDDLIMAAGETGAGHVDEAIFNSCCYYIYAAIDMKQLAKNLVNHPNKDAILRDIVPTLLDAMTYVNPTGKKNPFPGNVQAEAILVECKSKRIPVSYANAFTTPAQTTRENNVLSDSVLKLRGEVNTMDSKYALPTEARLWFSLRDVQVPQNATECAKYPMLKDALGAVISW